MKFILTPRVIATILSQVRWSVCSKQWKQELTITWSSSLGRGLTKNILSECTWRELETMWTSLMQLTLSFAVTLLFRPTQLNASQHRPLSLSQCGSQTPNSASASQHRTKHSRDSGLRFRNWEHRLTFLIERWYCFSGLLSWTTGICSIAWRNWVYYFPEEHKQ